MERNYHCFYLSVSKYCITLFLFMIFFFLISKTNRSLLHQSFCFFYFLFPIEQCFFIVIHILLATSRKLPLLRGGVGFQADERNAVLIAGAKIISESDYNRCQTDPLSHPGVGYMIPHEQKCIEKVTNDRLHAPSILLFKFLLFILCTSCSFKRNLPPKQIRKWLKGNIFSGKKISLFLV